MNDETRTFKFRFLLMLDVKSVVDGHKAFLNHAQLRVAILEHQIKNMSVIGKLACGGRSFRKEADALLEMIDAAAFLGTVNLAGFLRILSKFSVLASPPPSTVAALRARILASSFAVDAAPGGRLAAAVATLARLGLSRPAAQRNHGTRVRQV